MGIEMATLLASLLGGLALGPWVIKKLRAFKMGQNIRAVGPESHKIKQGVPSMGGIIFLTMLALVGSIFSFLDPLVLFMIFVTFAFGFVGFLDDYLKVKKKSSDGLRAKEKMGLLLLFGIATALVLYVLLDYDSVRLPFVKSALHLGIFYIPFVVIFFAAVTNAVNLTDGIDGLSSSVTIVVLIFFVLVGLSQGQSHVVIFSLALMGGLLAFLYYNKYPAKVFMGDTGSLALGGAVAILALLTFTELLLILVGIVYVVETLSVIIQVAVFKKTKKRVFLMSPIHHHFEALGWKENKIVAVFSLVTLAMVVLVYVLM
ncbi:MAG TPA: phospho-N-acetylmuramoyl-pentapeptide-transferase [Clostridiaceae bacterium]|nr:phospho-N-acetylmuramoyl-pentapeptide-transferase [Clostridiaceae bacterium]